MTFCRAFLSSYFFVYCVKRECLETSKPHYFEKTTWCGKLKLIFQSETLLSAQCGKKDICVGERTYSFELDYTEGEKN